MKKLTAFILSILMLLCAAIPAIAAGYDLNEAKKSVVRIVTEYTVVDTSSVEYGKTFYGTGSGFCIGKLEDKTVDYVVTAAHVAMRNLDSGTMSVPTTVTKKTDGSIGYVEVRVDSMVVLLDDIDHYERAQFVSCLPEADVALLRQPSESASDYLPLSAEQRLPVRI